MLFQNAVRFIEAHAKEILADPRNGIIGVGIGKKDEGPITAGPEFCVTAFVERKFSDATLESRRTPLFAKIVAGLLGGDVGPDDTDVVDIGGPFRLQQYRGSDHANPPSINTQKWFSAIRSGISITNPEADYPRRLTAGTLGFFVDFGGNRYLVSNNHVIAREDAGHAGEKIVQPGTADLPGSDITAFSNVSDLSKRFGIAELAFWVPVALHAQGNQPSNSVDAAMARLFESEREATAHARFGYGGRFAGVATPYEWDPRKEQIVGSPHVHKVGRSTGCTEGYVSGISGVIDLPFGNGTATFVDQIIVRPGKDNTGPFSDAGDSGSAVLNSDHEIVGLLFAGGQRRSLVNSIDAVLRELSKAANGATLAVVKN
jgi:hypothetical protein